ncbi:MAG TPA: exodeoxyribonuclease VII small subunit [Thiolapillus brandeum]|uniref:Exodeoxyribonuclease 7 small subunit n=1 Tax=Thiolapillus brandeum TaxID=1076588 RepID=A0A7C5MVR8_9GAMM|nr:exodeoxyribonuclease VII small subunit [Thiolapillus brandeum]
MSPRKPKNPPLEEALEELEEVVNQLEQGDLPLEQALKLFERGITLTRSCQRSLEEAEQKVKILSEKSLDAEPEPFEPDQPG